MERVENNKLVAYKVYNNLTWNEFALRIGIHKISLMRIVNGDVSDLKLSTVIMIKIVTGLDYSEYIDPESLPALAKLINFNKKIKKP